MGVRGWGVSKIRVVQARGRSFILTQNRNIRRTSFGNTWRAFRSFCFFFRGVAGAHGMVAPHLGRRCSPTRNGMVTRPPLCGPWHVHVTCASSTGLSCQRSKRPPLVARHKRGGAAASCMHDSIHQFVVIVTVLTVLMLHHVHFLKNHFSYCSSQ